MKSYYTQATPTDALEEDIHEAFSCEMDSQKPFVLYRSNQNYVSCWQVAHGAAHSAFPQVQLTVTCRNCTLSRPTISMRIWMCDCWLRYREWVALLKAAVYIVYIFIVLIKHTLRKCLRLFDAVMRALELFPLYLQLRPFLT